MEKLTVQEAFEAMVIYWENLYFETKSDDIGAFLGDMIQLEDGNTFDPAAWEKWIDAVNQVLNKNKSD